MLTKTATIIVYLIAAGTLGCGLFSGKSDEIVLAPTEVGTPEGPAVAREIGPVGGTLSSSDERITLTIPPNAVTETTTFSIQPITNALEDGFGSAYRVEPSGKQFKTPVQLSIRYSDAEVEGTFPEGFRLGYQDEQGAWHEQNRTTLDRANKRITISTNHLSDWSMYMGHLMRIYPAKPVVYVGESVVIKVRYCGALLPTYWFKRRPPCETSPLGVAKGKENYYYGFHLDGPGTLAGNGNDGGVVYTAPPKKPTPNVATVLYYEMAGFIEDDRLEAKITILDRAYRATGRLGDLETSGVICSLDEPFTIHGTIIGYPMKYMFNFTPSSSNAGTVEWAGSGYLVTAKGGGTYTIEGRETDSPKIVMKTESNVGHAPPGSASGPLGTGKFVDLVPLDTKECTEPAPSPPVQTPPPPPQLRGKGPF